MDTTNLPRSRLRTPLALAASIAAATCVAALSGPALLRSYGLTPAQTIPLAILAAAVAALTSARLLRSWRTFGDTPTDRALAAVVLLLALLLSTLDLLRAWTQTFALEHALRKAFVLLLHLIAATIVAGNLLERRTGTYPRALRIVSRLTLSLFTLGLFAAVEAWAVAKLPDDWYGFVNMAGKRTYLHQQTDPELFWKMRPSFRGRLVHPEFSGILVQTNSSGFRDLEFRPEKEPGVPLRPAIVLGDSFTFGLGVEEPETFVRRLERAKIAPRVWNAGGSGFCNFDEIVVLDRLASIARPSLVLVMVYAANDLEENLTFLRKHRGEDRRTFLAGVCPAAVDIAAGLEVGPAQYSGRMPDFAAGIGRVGRVRLELESRSKAVRRLFDALDRRAVSFGLRSPRIVANPFEVASFVRAPSREVETAIDATAAALATLRVRAAALGARTLVCFVPAKVQAHAADFLAALARDGGDPAAVDMDRPQSVLLARCAAAGVETLDLLPAVRASVARGERPYFEEGHWNAWGHELAAREIARFLAEHP